MVLFSLENMVAEYGGAGTTYRFSAHEDPGSILAWGYFSSPLPLSLSNSLPVKRSLFYHYRLEKPQEETKKTSVVQLYTVYCF